MMRALEISLAIIASTALACAVLLGCALID